MIYCASSSLSGFFTTQYLIGSKVVVGLLVVVVVIFTVVGLDVVGLTVVVKIVVAMVVSIIGSEI